MSWLDFFRGVFWDVAPHHCVPREPALVLPSAARPGWFRIDTCRRCGRLMPDAGIFATEAEARGLTPTVGTRGNS